MRHLFFSIWNKEPGFFLLVCKLIFLQKFCSLSRGKFNPKENFGSYPFDFTVKCFETDFVFSVLRSFLLNSLILSVTILKDIKELAQILSFSSLDIASSPSEECSSSSYGYQIHHTA